MLGTTLLTRPFSFALRRLAIALFFIYCIQLGYLLWAEDAPSCNCLGKLVAFENAQRANWAALIRNILVIAGLAAPHLVLFQRPKIAHIAPAVLNARQRITGFTLPDLIITLGIISLLISLTISSINSVRRRAVALQCQSNLRQVGIAGLLYANDNADFALRDASYWKPEFGWWPVEVARYIAPKVKLVRESDLSRVPVLQCPAHPKKNVPTEFVVNAFAFEAGEPPESFVAGPTKLSQIRTPEKVAWFFDGGNTLKTVFSKHDYIEHVVFHDVWSLSHLPAPGRMSRIDVTRHLPGSTNVLFFDGHVATVSVQEITLSMLDDGIDLHGARIANNPLLYRRPGFKPTMPLAEE